MRIHVFYVFNLFSKFVNLEIHFEIHWTPIQYKKKKTFQKLPLVFQRKAKQNFKKTHL